MIEAAGKERLELELLSPVGDSERLDAAIAYGADAVYLAGREFGMRSAPANFTDEELDQAVKKAHEHQVKVYLTCNTLPREEELKRLPEFLERAKAAGIDAFIISDFGVMRLAQKYAPGVEIHISTQAGIVNHEAANAFYDLGASRVVLASELCLEEIAEIRAHTPRKLQIEAFVHGAMCVSFSGRCLISEYLAHRDANRGDCTQPCRWKYALVEEKRPGQYMPVVEEDGGTYLMNSRDMCMIEYIPQLAKAGISSLKIEGRAKSAYYVAAVTNAYRHALDAFYQKPNQPLEPWIREELEKISHREYSTGFYLGTPPGQEYHSGGYVRHYEVIAVCEGWENGFVKLSQRNRFFKGDIADVLEPGGIPFQLPLDEIFDAFMEPITAAPHATMTVYAKCSRPVKQGAFLRKRIDCIR